ncbi:hypothetical protein PF008_g3081 [Phytophthora fragariae]|uniref:Uncharacterized protein n=1 Tax=Phytophthora fragariae TaxID=53985 RepID=A0A6G0SHA9_9STRA|nr:hypothetical protein PF008_g3081 [Phytophthora fragariae]
MVLKTLAHGAHVVVSTFRLIFTTEAGVNEPHELSNWPLSSRRIYRDSASTIGILSSASFYYIDGLNDRYTKLVTCSQKHYARIEPQAQLTS